MTGRNRELLPLKMGTMLLINVVLISFSAAHHVSVTGRRLPSASKEGQQTHPYRPELHATAMSAQEQLSPKRSKDAVSQSSFVFNRKLLNSEKAASEATNNQKDRLQGNMPPSSDTHSSSDKPMKSASPFSISIQGRNFYGGLITYSHDLHPARICRVMNGCLRNDDTLVLPQWMQRHDNTLKFQCGYPNVEFSLPDNEAPPSLKRLDLVGIKSSRPSMADFVSDFVPSAVMFDLIYGDHQVSKTCHSRRGKDCSSFPGFEEGFKPAVILHPRLRSLAAEKCWVRQFVGLMKPPGSSKQAEILYADSFRAKEADMTCFQSVLFTRGPFNRNLIMDDHLRNIHFLQSQGIVRSPRDVLSSPDSLSTSKGCSLNVTITNRQRGNGPYNRLTGRYMTNIPEIRKAILERAQRIPGLQLNVASLTLEGKSLRWQINAMQNTDIWIAGYGPLLTNMIFLRENSSVVEVQPFAYYPQTYEKLADRIAHVSFERYIADPDVAAFKTCINQLYDEGHPGRKEASKLLGRYIRASQKYFESDTTHSLILHGLKGEDLVQVKTCAKMQRLKMNGRNFAIAVVRHARLRCGFPKPGVESNGTTELK